MIVSPEEFNFQAFSQIQAQKRQRGNQGTRQRTPYKDIITAFDIETTRIREIEQSVMYVWQWQFGPDLTVVGRTWEQFLEFVTHLSQEMPEQKLCVFVHNLSYEFQFLRGIYHFEPTDVFAIKSRKVLKCEMLGNIEFRCSYIHSNMSLDEYTRKMGVQHKKLTGMFDYAKQRFPWTPLDETELAYCIHDVQGLVEAITIEMQHDGDNLYTFPLTSTGYVRRDAKRAMREVSRAYVKAQLPDYNIYQMLREAFRGGNTHANRFYVGDTIHDVHSADRSSSYPDVLCNCKFPVSQFVYDGELPLDDVVKLIAKRRRALIMRVAFSGIRLKRYDWGCPYLSRDKTRNIQGAEYDNGRILNAEYLETTLTDIDLEIVLSEYEFDDVRIWDCAHARYGNLPAQFIRQVCVYYNKKTALKGVPGEEIQYMKSKNKLNSLYGMCAQDPIKQDILFEDDEFKEQHEDPAKLLEQHNKKAFLVYQWGVWVTAWARLRLEEGVRLAHGDVNDPKAPQFLYCDTDSVKYTGEIDWTKYNQERIKASRQSKAFATDPNGVTHFMGVFEKEHDLIEFRTLGAKKYVSRETKDSKLVCTIAGVSKSLGGKELEKYGGIEAFKVGFKFTEAGGLEAVYNDKPEITEYTVDGHKISITSNVVLRESTYTLGLAADYERLLTKIYNKYY